MRLFCFVGILRVMIKVVAITMIVPILIIISALSVSYTAKKERTQGNATTSLKTLQKEGVVR